MKLPLLSLVEWSDARRIISTRHPPIDLFEDIADPADWALLGAAESKTNPRIAETIGNLDLVPENRRVGGPGASLVMAPFTHVSTDRQGRFHDGNFGAYYAARTFKTAVAETASHRAIFLRATAEAPGWSTQMRELVGSVTARLHDVRKDGVFEELLSPDDWGPSRALARVIRDNGGDGIVYPSVRDPGGHCLAAFWPDVIAIPRPARALGYHFDGEHIDLVRDEDTGTVWRLIRD
ncbi:MAG: RES family NAD+ phosphorylase [Pacificimonas sp.]